MEMRVRVSCKSARPPGHVLRRAARLYTCTPFCEVRHSLLTAKIWTCPRRSATICCRVRLT
eukprot:10427072-Lingulodinium_polyedra.AAC.1